MTGFDLATLPVARAAVALLTVLATLLPLPARCAACSNRLNTGCTRCAAARPAKPPCRTRHAGCQPKGPLVVDACCVDRSIECSAHYTPCCGCSVRPADRVPPSADRGLVVRDLLAPTDHMAPIAKFEIGVSNLLLRAGRLAPSIPHRILHCIWLI
jgi:hypothetical protein